MLERRELISLAAALVPVAALGAEPEHVPRIGFVAPQGGSLPLFDAFRSGLASLGFTDGKDVVIAARFAEGQYVRFPQIFSELIGWNANLLAVTGAVTARAAIKALAGSIPIIFAVVVDPVADGVVSSLVHPGGMITGITSFDPEQPRRQLSLLRQVAPLTRHVAILGDAGVSDALISLSTRQAADMNLQCTPLRVGSADANMEAVVSKLVQLGADSLLVLEEPILGVRAKQIAQAAVAHRLPSVFPPSRVEAGGLLAYGASQTAAIRRMAAQVIRVLHGAAVGTLDVERVVEYELYVDLGTAKAIGISVPVDILTRATAVRP